MNRQCDEVRDNLAGYQAQKLLPDESARVAAHLKDCADCQIENAAQRQMHDSLRGLRNERFSDPAPRIWNQAAAAWDVRDEPRVRQMRFQYAAFASLLVFCVFGAVLARMNAKTDFPTRIVENDVQQVYRANFRPEHSTPDADNASRWLGSRLNAKLQPFSGGREKLRLLGADVVTRNAVAMGRLTYRTRDNRLVAIYIAPRATDFPALGRQSYQNAVFSIDAGQGKYGLIGWNSHDVGYALVMENPVETDGLSIAWAAHDAMQ